MMSKEEVQSWVRDEMSALYWKFRDDVDDEGGERLVDELDYTEKKLVEIISKHITA